MKKILIVLIATLLIIQIPTYVIAGDGDIDQSYTEGEGTLLICTGSRMYQEFKPSKGILTKVEIDIANASGSIGVVVKHNPGSGWVNTTDPISKAVSNGWNDFDFENVAVTPGQTYTISVTGDCGPHWKYGEGNPYSDGEMVWQSMSQPTRDFNFMTFGKDEVSEPDPTSTPMPNSGDDPNGEVSDDDGSENVDGSDEVQGQDSSSGEIFVTPSSDIVKPENLIAKYVTKEKAVLLAWKASATSDIDGYKIFRSNKKDTGYIKVGEVSKAKKEFKDSNPLSGRVLYYQVRAYKGTKQSVSSNTASVVVPAVKTSPVAVADAAISKTFLQTYWPYLLIVVVILLIAGALIARKIIINRKKSRANPPNI